MPDVEPDMELDSKIKIGLFISNIFNNPFVFERLEKIFVYKIIKR